MDYVHTWKHIQEVYCQRGRENESLKKRIDQLVMDAWKQNGDWMWLINIYLFFLLNFFAACMLFAMQRPKSLCWDQKALGVSNEDWRPTSCPNPPNPWHEVFGLLGRNCHHRKGQGRALRSSSSARTKLSHNSERREAAPLFLDVRRRQKQQEPAIQWIQGQTVLR
jgi:hypothetical protein